MSEDQKTKNEEETKKSPSIETGDIYVMPEKFYPSSDKSKNKNLKLILIIGGIFFLCLIIAAIVVLFSIKLEQEAKPAERSEAVEEPSVEVAPEEEEPKAEEIIEKIEVEEEIELPEEEELPVEPTIPLPPIPVSSIDTDKDGLTDEEEILYSTGLNRPDSDADGYLDSEEIKNLYNPAGPGLLSDSELVSIYNSSQFNYNIFYPSAWLSRSIDDTGREVIFNSDTKEFIQVIVADNKLGLSPLDWYLNQSPGVSREQVTLAENKHFTGIKSPDTLTLYLVPKTGETDLIYIITYNIGTRTEMNFKTTFDMMVNSFTLKSEMIEEIRN